jgi:HEAT repeat protein
MTILTTLRRLAYVSLLLAPLAPQEVLALPSPLSQDKGTELAESKVNAIIDELKGGVFGPATDQEVDAARAGDLIPMLKGRFARSKGDEVKSRIASDLVLLGDKDDMYWNFLVEQVEPILESEVPNPRCTDSPPNCVKAMWSPQYAAWAEANHVPLGSDSEEGLRNRSKRISELAATQDHRAIPFLRRALSSPDFEVEETAAQGLDWFHDRDSIPLMIEACKKAPPLFASVIAGGLDWSDDPRAQAVVNQYLPKQPDPLDAIKSDDHPEYHIEEVVDAHELRAIPTLKRMFEATSNSNDKAHVASALLRLGVRDPLYWDYLEEQAATAIESDAPWLLQYDQSGKQLPDPSPDFVAWAKARNLAIGDAVEEAFFWNPGKVSFLAEIGDARAIPLLRRALTCRNPLIRVVAAKGLALLKDKDSIPQIIAACEEANADGSQAIAQALIFFDDPRAQRAADKYLSKEMAAWLRKDRDKGNTPFQE